MYDSDYNDAGSDMVPGVEQREQSEDSTEQPEPAAEVDGEWGETIELYLSHFQCSYLYFTKQHFKIKPNSKLWYKC